MKEQKQTERIGIRVTKPTGTFLKNYARKNKMSVSNAIRILLKEWLESQQN